MAPRRKKLRRCRNYGYQPPLTTVLSEPTTTALLPLSSSLSDLSNDELKVDSCETREMCLISAARNGNVSLVKNLIDDGAEVQAKDRDGQTSLCWAAKNGHLEVINMLIKFGVNVNGKGERQKTPLCWAAERGHVEVVRTLIEAGASVDEKDGMHGKTPLCWAALGGHTDVVEALIDAGSDVDARDKYERSLFWAAVFGNTDVVKALIRVGANVDAKSRNGQTPLFQPAGKGHKDVVDALVKAGADLDAKNECGWTALCWAARTGRTNIVETLLKAGANCNTCNSSGETPLSVAIANGHTKVGEALVRYMVLSDHVKQKPDIVRRYSYSSFWDECKQQVEKMPNLMLGDSAVSLYTFLRETDGNKLVVYLSNPSTVRWIDQYWFSDEFPEYVDIIRDKVRAVKNRESLLYKYSIVSRHCDLSTFPAEINTKIVMSLRDVDLENFIKAAIIVLNRKPK